MVRVPSPLRDYTGGGASISARGASVAEILADIERQHQGMRFRMIDEQDRIRPHIRIFVNQREVHTLDEAVGARDEIHLICALSGG
ncbi:MAG: MoaD/ThiS family protein [Gammaproteobacteria bacterium]|nr:MoaD/ThiS family protein [Gammaproteobacteria bacterium]MDE2250052.1 MoaD/ThiS family protein [Gammaproteobacteria bacterium]